jgi:arabinan endo-1,5-alpha-L-arabinosidase
MPKSYSLVNLLQDKARVLLRSNLKHIVEERLVAEAPWMMYKKGYYYLFYSSGWTFETKYHIRVARGRQVTGPFVRTQRPVLTTDWERYNQGINCSFIGPGHGSIIESGGDWWMIYHAWLYGQLNQEPGRVLMMDKVVWKEGWPIVGVPSDTPQHVPTIHPLQNV